MKLAEALMLRADLQKALASLRERAESNALVQQGDQPAEDPTVLLRDSKVMLQDLNKLLLAINRANLRHMTKRKRPLTEALALRDALRLEHALVSGVAQAAVKLPDRYGAKEVRWVSTVNAASLQRRASKLAQALRQLNGEIQEANWSVDIGYTPRKP